MTQKIKGTGKYGERIGETFPRRARRLVETGRAEWTEAGRTLRLLKEDVSLDYEINTNGARAKEYTPSPPPHHAAPARAGDVDEATLMRVARSRLAEKHRLNRHALITIALVIFSGIAYPAIFNYEYEVMLAVYASAALTIMAARYALFFTRGLRRAKGSPLLREYDRLRRMRPEDLQDEVRRTEAEPETHEI